MEKVNSAYDRILMDRITKWETGYYENASAEQKRAVLVSIAYWSEILKCRHLLSDKLFVTMAMEGVWKR